MRERIITHRNATGIFPLIMCACLFEIAKELLKFRSIRSIRNSSKQIFPFVFININSLKAVNKINIE